MLRKELEKLNLNKKEAILYLALLELGEALIRDIVRKTSLKRTTIYDILDSLKEKGLINSSKKQKRTFYYAESPLKLEKLLDEKKTILKTILPQLMSITNLLEKKPKIRYYEGIEGIKDVYRDTLKYANQETLAWTTSDAVKYFDVDWLWNYYIIKRVGNKIWQRAISPEQEYMKNLKKFDKEHLRQSRYAPNTLSAMEVEINLYGKKCIGIMAFRDKLGLIIESKVIFNTLKSIFEMNWAALKNK